MSDGPLNRFGNPTVYSGEPCLPCITYQLQIGGEKVHGETYYSIHRQAGRWSSSRSPVCGIRFSLHSWQHCYLSAWTDNQIILSSADIECSPCCFCLKVHGAFPFRGTCVLCSGKYQGIMLERVPTLSDGVPHWSFPSSWTMDRSHPPQPLVFL